MPYLTIEDRVEFKELQEVIEKLNIDKPGKLNYCITLLAKQALKDKIINYTLLNGIYGAMALATKEFWLRIIEPYERDKQEENGDVYENYRD